MLGASSWNLPGSDVGGDLTGGSVDIYVANKTILSGAVIASDIDKLKLDTGSLEYRNIKDRDRGSNFDGGGNISGGAAPKSNSQSLSVSYGFTDKRQTNFATIGEGEITVMDGKTDLSKLNRDTSISQYNTKDGGLQGGFTLDSTTVNFVTSPIETVKNTVAQIEKGLGEAKDTALLIYDETGKVVDKASNWVNDHLFTNDEGKTENTEKGGSTSEQLAFNQLMSDQKMAEYREAAAKRGIPTETTKEIMEDSGWDGDPIDNSMNPKVINQMSMTELKAADLPEKYGACVFLTTVYCVADALGVELTPKEAGAVYNYAKNQNPPSIGIDSDGNPSAYWVDSYPGLLKAVAAVKNVDASNISIPNSYTDCSTPDLSNNATKKIIEALKSGGSAEIRYGADPNKSTSSAHSMRVTGSFIENGKVILSIKDTAAPNTKTFVDTSTMKLYTLNEDGKRVYSKRPVSSYLPITKNNNVATNNK